MSNKKYRFCCVCLAYEKDIKFITVVENRGGGIARIIYDLTRIAVVDVVREISTLICDDCFHNLKAADELRKRLVVGLKFLSKETYRTELSLITRERKALKRKAELPEGIKEKVSKWEKDREIMRTFHINQKIAEKENIATQEEKRSENMEMAQDDKKSEMEFVEVKCFKPIITSVTEDIKAKPLRFKNMKVIKCEILEPTECTTCLSNFDCREHQDPEIITTSYSNFASKNR